MIKGINAEKSLNVNRRLSISPIILVSINLAPIERLHIYPKVQFQHRRQMPLHRMIRSFSLHCLWSRLYELLFFCFDSVMTTIAIWDMSIIESPWVNESTPTFIQRKNIHDASKNIRQYISFLKIGSMIFELVTFFYKSLLYQFK